MNLSSCAKYFLIVFNSIFILLGLGVLAGGIYVYLQGQLFGISIPVSIGFFFFFFFFFFKMIFLLFYFFFKKTNLLFVILSIYKTKIKKTKLWNLRCNDRWRNNFLDFFHWLFWSNCREEDLLIYCTIFWIFILLIILLFFQKNKISNFFFFKNKYFLISMILIGGQIAFIVFAFTQKPLLEDGLSDSWDQLDNATRVTVQNQVSSFFSFSFILSNKYNHKNLFFKKKLQVNLLWIWRSSWSSWFTMSSLWNWTYRLSSKNWYFCWCWFLVYSNCWLLFTWIWSKFSFSFFFFFVFSFCLLILSHQIASYDYLHSLFGL